MQLPSKDASTETHLDYCDFIEGAIESWEDAEIITKEQQAALTEVKSGLTPKVTALRTSLSTREQAERGVRKANARFTVRDSILDLRVMTLSDTVLNGPAGRSREHPNFQTLFRDKTAGEITRAAIREEPELVKSLLERYDNLLEFPQKSQVRSDTADALEKSLAARDALDTAEAALRKAENDELAAFLGLRQALDGVYGALRKAFPGRRDFVESFFPKYNKARTKKETPSSPE